MTALPIAKHAPIPWSPLALEVHRGLRARPKTLSPWLFYDSEGSRLFEKITELPEYYVTRTERVILAQNAPEMVTLAADGQRLAIVELGAGTASKTGLLLSAALERQKKLVYSAIDVSESALEKAKDRLESELPGVTVETIVSDYTREMDPAVFRSHAGNSRRLVLYIGSSIGNFAPSEALALLRRLRACLVPGDRLLLGTDLVKNHRIIVAAYNDAAGVTAAFNLNVLARINRELGANFRLPLFRHRAVWNPFASRIEMHLESLVAQQVTIRALGLSFPFDRGETIHTENSYKFTCEGVASLLGQAGFTLRQCWTDPQKWFGVHLASVR